MKALNEWLQWQKDIEGELTDQNFDIYLSNGEYIRLGDQDEIPKFDKRKIIGIRWYNPEYIVEYGKIN